MRKRDHPEVIRPRPVERRAVHHQQLLLQQQVENELLVVDDGADVRIDAREHVQRATRLDDRHPGNFAEELAGPVSLLKQTATGKDEFIDALVAAKRCLNRVLRRDVGTQPHRGEHVQAFQIAPGPLLRAGNRHPARAETRHPVGLRQTVERQAQQIGREGRGADVLGPVVENLVVDLVGEDHQPVFARQFDDLLEHFPRVHRARRIVRVDDHHGLGVGRDLLAQVVYVGEPVGPLIAQVVHRCTAAEPHGRRPQRVVGRGDEDLVVVVEESLRRHHDQFRRAVAEEDVVDGDPRHSARLVILHDRLAAGEQTLRVAVALRRRQIVDDVGENLLGSLEAERGGIADVQLEDPMPFLLEPLRMFEDGSADVVTDVGELGRLLDVHPSTVGTTGRGPTAALPRVPAAAAPACDDASPLPAAAGTPPVITREAPGGPTAPTCSSGRSRSQPTRPGPPASSTESRRRAGPSDFPSGPADRADRHWCLAHGISPR